MDSNFYPSCWLVASIIAQALAIEIANAQHFQEIANSVNMNRLYGNNGHAVADFDRDGDLDVFIVALKSFTPVDQTSLSRLKRNDGGVFTDVSTTAGFGNQFSN